MNSAATFEFKLHGEDILLLPEKAAFWLAKKMLIVSDLHIGKAGHFRKHGIPVPQASNDSNLSRLQLLVDKLKPERILFLGDLFHSLKNEEWDVFKNWRLEHHKIKCLLVLGNHDMADFEELDHLDLIVSNTIEAPPFMFVHDAESTQDEETELFIISGHVHPAVKLKGKGRQTLRVPCFYFGERYALLPAFGSFTGTFVIKPGKNDCVFAVTNEQILVL